ncbi:hypothetical protein D1007_23016 [Hordeum vulgare]|nr:hypothetical protein D1007_23016 [Hordeum vulgare]
MGRSESFYSFWLWLNKQTGLGRSPNGELWQVMNFEKNILRYISCNFYFHGSYCCIMHIIRIHLLYFGQGHAAWRKLKYGPPENLFELEIMFEHTAVDGSTSCVAREQMDDEGDIGEEGGDEADVRPLSVSNNKRSSNWTAAVTSPKKRIKSPMVRIMKGMYEEMKETNAAAQKAMHEKVVQAEKALQEKKESITNACPWLLRVGAFEGSAEHFMARTLFVKEEHRQVFLTITTSPGRLAFLKRWCRAKNVE